MDPYNTCDPYHRRKLQFTPAEVRSIVLALRMDDAEVRGNLAEELEVKAQGMERANNILDDLRADPPGV